MCGRGIDYASVSTIFWSELGTVLTVVFVFHSSFAIRYYTIQNMFIWFNVECFIHYTVSQLYTATMHLPFSLNRHDQQCNQNQQKE